MVDSEDQLIRLKKELHDGTWIVNTQNRSRRRKSAWNLLLPLFGLPLWAAITILLISLSSTFHSMIHTADEHTLFGAGAISTAAILVLISSAVMATIPAMLLTNYLVSLIPPARRSMEEEDRDFPGTDYESSRRALFKMALWASSICLPLALISAALG